MGQMIIMKKSGILFLFLFIVLMYSFVSAQEGMGKGRVKGIVVDEKGNVIPGAKITANHQKFSKTFTATTNKKGEWSILGMASGIWRFTAEKEGYIPGYADTSISQLSKNPVLTIKITSSEKSGLVADSESRQLLNNARQLFEQDKYDEAIAEYQKFLEKNPSAYQVHYNIGEAYFRKENYDKAIEHFETFLENDPEDLPVNRKTAESYVKKGDLEKSLPYFEKITEKDPDDPTSYYDIGEIYFGAGKVANAIEYYNKAISLQPDWEKPYIKLAYAYMNANQIEKAVENFEKYLEIAPEGEDASIAKEFLKQLKPQ